MSMTFFRSKRNSVFTMLIFGAIIFTFILWGGQRANTTSPTALTVVNGEEISYSDFQKKMAQDLKMYGQFMQGNKINDSLMQMIERKVVQELVMRKAFAQKAAEAGIRVGNEEILEILQKEKAFHDPKLNRFSPAVYQAVLQANDLKPASFEAEIREDILINRYRGILEDSLSVSDSEIQDAYRLEKTEFTLDSGTFDGLKLAEQKKLNISDKEVQEHFQKHQTEYMSPEKKMALVAALDTSRLAENQQISDTEVEAFFDQKVKNSKTSPLGAGLQARALHILISDSSPAGAKKAAEIMKSIRTEDDFRKAAKNFSEDFSNASQGGDLGYFNETAMVKPFSNAVFGKSAVHKVIGPVQTSFGHHLIWILDRPTAEITVKNRANQIRYLISQDKVSAQMDQLKTSVKKLVDAGGDISTALKKQGFEISETQAFDAKSRIGNLPFVIQQEAVSAPKDKWQGPQENGKTLYVYKITNIFAPKPMTIAEAKPLIAKKLEAELTEKLVKDLHVKLIEKKSSWEDLAKAGADIKTTKNFKPFKTPQIPNFSESEVLTRLVQELRPSAPVSNPVIQEGKWVFFRASNFTPVASAPADADMHRIKADLLSKKRSYIIQEFTQNLLKTAKIPKDFRSKYNI